MNTNNKWFSKLYRKKDLELLEEKLMMLGDNKHLSASTFMTIRIVTTIIVFIVTLYNSNINYIFAPAFAVLYYYAFYYIFIVRRLNNRVKKLDREAFYFFEILTLTLESGRNLENAIQVTCDNVNSELSKEFQKMLCEMQFGKSLVESLQDMKKRIPSDTINHIILSITQTNVFGNSILSTMYDQVEFLRDKQILEIKGEIAKIPNKISMISVVFIVPLILMLILGPLLINFLG